MGLDRSVLTIDGRCYRTVVWERMCGGLGSEVLRGLSVGVSRNDYAKVLDLLSSHGTTARAGATHDFRFAIRLPLGGT